MLLILFFLCFEFINAVESNDVVDEQTALQLLALDCSLNSYIVNAANLTTLNDDALDFPLLLAYGEEDGDGDTCAQSSSSAKALKMLEFSQHTTLHTLPLFIDEKLSHLMHLIRSSGYSRLPITTTTTTMATTNRFLLLNSTNRSFNDSLYYTELYLFECNSDMICELIARAEAAAWVTNDDDAKFAVTFAAISFALFVFFHYRIELLIMMLGTALALITPTVTPLLLELINIAIPRWLLPLLHLVVPYFLLFVATVKTNTLSYFLTTSDRASVAFVMGVVVGDSIFILRAARLLLLNRLPFADFSLCAFALLLTSILLLKRGRAYVNVEYDSLDYSIFSTFLLIISVVGAMYGYFAVTATETAYVALARILLLLIIIYSILLYVKEENRRGNVYNDRFSSFVGENTDVLGNENDDNGGGVRDDDDDQDDSDNNKNDDNDKDSEKQSKKTPSKDTFARLVDLARLPLVGAAEAAVRSLSTTFSRRTRHRRLQVVGFSGARGCGKTRCISSVFQHSRLRSQCRLLLGSARGASPLAPFETSLASVCDIKQLIKMNERRRTIMAQSLAFVESVSGLALSQEDEAKAEEAGGDERAVATTTPTTAAATATATAASGSNASPSPNAASDCSVASSLAASTVAAARRLFRANRQSLVVVFDDFEEASDECRTLLLSYINELAGYDKDDDEDDVDNFHLFLCIAERVPFQPSSSHILLLDKLLEVYPSLVHFKLESLKPQDGVVLLRRLGFATSCAARFGEQLVAASRGNGLLLLTFLQRLRAIQDQYLEYDSKEGGWRLSIASSAMIDELKGGGGGGGGGGSGSGDGDGDLDGGELQELNEAIRMNLESGRLSSLCLRILATGASIGATFDAAVVASILNMPLIDVLDQLEIGESLGIVVDLNDEDDCFEFSSGAYVDALRARSSAAMRRELSAQLARAFFARLNKDDDGDYDDGDDGSGSNDIILYNAAQCAKLGGAKVLDLSFLLSIRCARLCFRRLQLHAAAAHARTAVEAARKLKMSTDLISYRNEMCVLLGEIILSLDPGLAQEVIDVFDEFYSSLDAKAPQAAIILALCYAYRGRLDESKALASTVVVEATGERVVVARAYWALSFCHWRGAKRSDWLQGLETSKKGFETICPSSSSSSSLSREESDVAARLCAVWGGICAKLKQSTNSIRLLRQSLQLRPQDDYVGIGISCGMLARQLRQGNDVASLQEALKLLDENERVSRLSGNVVGLIRSAFDRAELLYWNLKRTSDAADAFALCLKRARFYHGHLSMELTCELYLYCINNDTMHGKVEKEEGLRALVARLSSSREVASAVALAKRLKLEVFDDLVDK